ncbi:MAG: TlyA family RNA methyltransferase [Pseudomonadota bacterium]
MRLDQALVARGLARSRSQARDQIVRGLVKVDGRAVSKAGLAVTTETRIDLAAAVQARVSRGGQKLAHAIEHFAVDPADLIAIDVGASTGGFTEELLGRGATHVYAVDIGTNQLHSSLRNDPRVTVLEQTDARSLTDAEIGQPINAIVSDVSFISLTKVLAPAMTLARPGAWLIALIKPQFELAPASIGKGGIVRSTGAHELACRNVEAWLDNQPRWRTHGMIPSPITGKAGNEEFLIAATRDADKDRV